MIKGSCHCKNIEYHLKTETSINKLYLRKCECSFCRKQGAVYTSDPEGVIFVKINNESNIIKYKFSTKLVEFVICGKCGVMPYVSMAVNQDIYAAINLKSSQINLEGKEIKILGVENESRKSSIKRRMKSWSKLVVSMQNDI